MINYSKGIMNIVASPRELFQLLDTSQLYTFFLNKKKVLHIRHFVEHY